MIKLGSQEVTKVMKGTEEVSAVYRGSEEVWSADQGGAGWIQTSLSDEGLVAAGATIYDVAHNGRVWAVTGNKGAFATSPDGVNWSDTGVYLLPEEDEAYKNATDEFDLTDGDFRGIVWTGTHWVVAGSLGNCTRSSDGVNWTTVPSLSTAVNGNRVYELVAHPEVAGEAIALSSQGVGGRTVNHGSSFSQIDMGVVGNFYGVAWNGNYWCAVGNSVAAKSSNGTSWSGTFVQSMNLKDVAWNGSVWCAIGLSGLCATSSDGLNWVSNNGIKDCVGSWNCRALTSDGKRFIAAGVLGKILVSEDGLVWEEHSQALEYEIYGICINDYGTVVGDTSTSVGFNEELKPAT